MSCKTAKGDECYTPFYAVEPLLEYLQILKKDNIELHRK